MQKEKERETERRKNTLNSSLVNTVERILQYILLNDCIFASKYWVWLVFRFVQFWCWITDVVTQRKKKKTKNLPLISFHLIYAQIHSFQCSAKMKTIFLFHLKIWKKKRKKHFNVLSHVFVFRLFNSFTLSSLTQTHTHQRFEPNNQ